MRTSKRVLLLTLATLGAILVVLGVGVASASAETKPVVFIGTPPLNPTNNPTASFTFTAEELGYTESELVIECQLNGGGFAPCSSPDVFIAPEGLNTFEVRATDPELHVSEIATDVWGVDLHAPNDVLTSPVQSQAFTLDQAFTPGYSCTDEPFGSPSFSSGIATCELTPSFDSGTLGPHLITLNGSDKAGNHAAPITVSYHVDPANYETFTKALNPIAFYRLSDPRGGTTLTDSSGNGYNGTYQNNVRLKRPSALNCENESTFTNFCKTGGDWYGGATTGTSAFFNGFGAYAYANNITLPYQAYTLEGWVNPDGRGNMGILQHGSGGAIYIENGDFIFRPSSNFTTPEITTPVSTYTGDDVHNPGWYLVAGTWNGTTASFYVDGQLVGSTGGVTGLSTSTSTFYVGLANINGIPTFHGNMQNVAYFASALDADSISDQWEIGTYDAYDYVWPTTTLDETAPEISNITPENNTAFSTDSSNGPFSLTFTSNEETEGIPIVCSDTLSINGGPPATQAIVSSPGPGSSTIWSSAIPAVAGSDVYQVSCEDVTDGKTTTRTIHYLYGTFPEVILNDNPLAYYRLDEPLGAETLLDSSGHVYNGQYKNDQNTFSAGVSGDSDSSHQFLGHGGYAYVNNIAAPTEGYTLEGWVALEDIGNQSVIEQGGAGSVFVRGGEYVFRVNANVATEVHGGTSGPCAPVASGSPLPGAPVFQEFDATWDGVYASLYINGHLCSAIEDSAPPFPSGSSTLYLGYGSQEPWLRGALDEVSYYNYALTPDGSEYHYLADPPTSHAATPSSPNSSAPSTSSATSVPVTSTTKATVKKTVKKKVKKATHHKSKKHKTGKKAKKKGKKSSHSR